MTSKHFIFYFLLLPIVALAQNTITATFSPAEEYRWAILYKNTPYGSDYVAQGKIENGNVQFNLQAKHTKGVYKLVYAAPQEDYNFDIIYNGNENISLTFSKDTGAVFQESSGNLLLNSYLSSMAAIGGEIEAFYISKNTDAQTLEALFQKQKETQALYEEKSKNTITYHFIKSNRPYIPDSYQNAEIYIDNLTSNYFQGIDFADPVLQSSNFLLERSLAYIAGVSHQGMDQKGAMEKNIETVVSKLQDTDPIFQKNFLQKVWQKMVNYNLHDGANYIASNHVLPLAESQKDTILIQKLIQFINLSIGNVAPEILWETEENGTTQQHKLSELAIADRYVLIFWSSGCSHCLEQMPKVKALMQSLDSSKYKVIAVGLEDQSLSWEKEIQKYPEFLHIIKLKKWDSMVVQDYALTSTPTFFVLDKDKKFIEKPENFEALEAYLKK